MTRKKSKHGLFSLIFAAGIFVAALQPLDAASIMGPRLSLRGSPRPPGTVALIEFISDTQPDELSWSGLGQQAGFYLAQEETEYIYFALVVVPLDTPAGNSIVEVRSRFGMKDFLHELPLAVTEDPYPSSRQPLKVKGFKKKIAEAVGSEKPMLTNAWDDAGGKPRWRGSFDAPVKKYRLSSPFGKRRVYEDGSTGWRHKGADMAAPVGTAVVAANHGKVQLAVKGLVAYGGVVVLSHGYDLATTYMHLSSVDVHNGQRIKKGQLIGRVGSEGIATGPHLHWQMTLRSLVIDPLQWMLKEDALPLPP